MNGVLGSFNATADNQTEYEKNHNVIIRATVTKSYMQSRATHDWNAHLAHWNIKVESILTYNSIQYYTILLLFGKDKRQT